MSTIATVRHRLANRRRDAELQRILRHSDPRVRAELIAITQEDDPWR